jgi:hypothetical protein
MGPGDVFCLTADSDAVKPSAILAVLDLNRFNGLLGDGDADDANTMCEPGRRSRTPRVTRGSTQTLANVGTPSLTNNISPT